jgi:hypothetical protein
MKMHAQTMNDLPGCAGGSPSRETGMNAFRSRQTPLKAGLPAFFYNMLRFRCTGINIKMAEPFIMKK